MPDPSYLELEEGEYRFSVPIGGKAIAARVAVSIIQERFGPATAALDISARFQAYQAPIHAAVRRVYARSGTQPIVLKLMDLQ